MDGRTCEDGRFDVGDQWYTGFDGTPTHFEAIGHSIGVHGIWHIDHHVHLAGLQEGEHVWLLYHISTLAERHETNQKTKETCRRHVAQASGNAFRVRDSNVILLKHVRRDTFLIVGL